MTVTISYEQILQRMLNRVLADNPNIDTRPSSIVYNACASCAAEVVTMHNQIDWAMGETFIDTASRPYLIKRCAERGIYVKQATFSIRQGEFNIDVPIGSRFSLKNTDVNYKAIEKISNGVFKMECETAGEIGNEANGQLIPIDYIDGLERAELTTVLIPAEDDEDTEHLRQRYYDSLDSQAFGGNIKDYKDKTNDLNGVGGVKVYPIWNGGGTVKLVIIASDFTVPSQLLIDTVQTAIDPTQNQGEGLGIAPIGHVVTVEGVTAQSIDVGVHLTFQDGWTWEDVRQYVHDAIDTYFEQLNKSWENENNLVVRISQIETRLLDLNGILDVAGTTINGVEENLALDSNSIPIRGSVTNA